MRCTLPASHLFKMVLGSSEPTPGHVSLWPQVSPRLCQAAVQAERCCPLAVSSLLTGSRTWQGKGHHSFLVPDWSVPHAMGLVLGICSSGSLGLIRGT